MTAAMNKAALRRSLVFLFITVVSDMVAQGMAIPVLPRLMEDFLHHDTARAAELFGLFNTLWALMQFLFMPLLGTLSDRVGRRPVLIVSIAGLGLDFLLMALAPNLSWLLAGRIIAGITSANVATANAYVADIAPPEKRSSAFGVILGALAIGLIMGPVIGGLLGAIHPRLPFWIAAVFCLANALYGLFVLPESLPASRRVKFDWLRANPVGSLLMLARRPSLYGLASLKFFADLAYAALTATFVLFAEHRFGWGVRGVGVGYGVIGIQVVIVQGTLVGRLNRRFGERIVLPAALILGMGGFAILALVADSRWVFTATPLLALCTVAQPTIQGLLTRRADATEQGRLQGALSSVAGVVGLIGPGLFTQTFAHFIRPGALYIPGAAFLLAIALLALALPLAIRETSRDPATMRPR